MSDYIFNKIIEYHISQDMIDLATLHEQKISAQKQHSQTTLPLNKRRDFLGSLGQQAVIEYLFSKGFSPEYTDYFDAKINRDECDLVWRGKLDVKTSSFDTEEIMSWSRLLISDHQKDKRVDNYIFVKVKDDEAYILGQLPYDDFWDISKPITYKTPCHYVTFKQLKGFREFVYGI